MGELNEIVVPEAKVRYIFFFNFSFIMCRWLWLLFYFHVKLILHTEYNGML